MHPKTKDTKLPSFLQRGKKHRVRKGITEALGVLGLGGESEEVGIAQGLATSSSFAFHPAASQKLPPPTRSSSTWSGASSSNDMSILSNLKKPRDSGSAAPSAATSRSTSQTLQPTSAPRASRSLPVPRPSKPEADRMSINSAAGTVVSETTTIANDESMLKKAKNSIRRAVSPSPAPRNRVSETQFIQNVHEAQQSLRAKLQAELKGSKEESLAAGITIESFLSYIGAERLRRMPAKGSRWDKILKWAEYFATSLSLFEEAVETFVASSQEAVELIFACLQILLQLGPGQGEAMERAFSIFHEYGLAFAFYLKHYSLLRTIPEARSELSLALGDMLALAIEITIFYRKSIRSMSTTAVTVDFNITFGRLMETFIQHKDSIANMFWTYQLKNSPEIADIHVSIQEIRLWLLPQDRNLQALVSGRRATRNLRAEFTCEWFDRPLIDFTRSKDNVLTITAETGAGKSILAGWILERLQRPIGKKTYQAIHATVDSQVPAQATQIALVKTLLHQLLEQNVGNVALYRCLSNVVELDTNTNSTQDAEDALWYTLETALKPLNNVVLVIDGLDALEGDESEKFEAYEQLWNIAAKNKNVRVIILSRPMSKPWPKPTRALTMGPERTTGDVKHMVRAYLLSRGIGNRYEVDEVAEQVAQRSKGSLTWAELVLQLFGSAKTITEVQTTVKELPSTTKEILDKHVSTISLKGDARLIFAWLLVADRPLTTSEIQCLLELNVQKGTHQPRSTNIIDDIQKACGSLVIVQDKTVRFRNESVRLHLLELSKESKYLMPPAEAHKDFATRLLLYSKVVVSRNTEPSMEDLSPREVDSLFRSNALLEYATRNWLTHFKKSPFIVEGQLQAITPELKLAFPSSTLLALLERSTWEKQTLLSKANEQHLLALRIRQQALGDTQLCTLQSSINVAQSYKKLSAPVEASKFFFQAAKLGQAVLGKANDLAISCATATVDALEGVKADTRNDEITRKEEMLKYVVETEKQRYGANSALATKYNNQLAQLYTDIKENDKAEAVYRDVYKLTIAQNGEFSQEASQAAEKLKTVLYKEAKHEDVVQYTQPIFESAERNLDIFDIRRVEITLRMADTWEEKEDLIHAEELYISLWRGLTEYCRANSGSNDAHERKIQISIAYAKFLKRHGREAEAQNILHGVWLDYQHRENKSEAVVKQLNQVGEELKAMGILETAIAVFKSVWGYFKGTGQQNSTAAVSTAVSLMGAQIQTAETLSTFYISKGRWNEAADVCTKILKQLWANLGVENKYGFPKHFTTVSIKFARRLAVCYTECNQTEQAEKVYNHLFLSARSSLRIQDELVAETANDLIEFHLRTQQYQKALVVYQQLLESYRTTLGARNPLTLKTLHTMGDLCLKYRLKGADQYFLEITKAEKGQDGVLTKDGFKAAQALSKIYYEQKRWDEARNIYATVWVTYTKKAKEYEMSPELVQAIFKRYHTVLETHLKVDVKTVRQLALEYRTTATAHYGPESQIATTASLQLAEVSRKIPEHQEEAVKICEEVVTKAAENPDKAKATPAQAILLATAKRHLAALYATQNANGQVSAESSQKAEGLWKEQLEINKKQHGVAHKSTLASLSSLVGVWGKSEKPEIKKQAETQLQTTVVEVLTAPTASDSTKLHESGASLAKIYLSANMSAQAWALLRDLRFQIISKEARGTAKVNVKLPETVDRRSMVFIAAFEETLRQTETVDATKKVTFSDIMTDMLTEGILYDRYHLTLQSKEVTIENKLFDGARLYAFLKGNKQNTEQCLAVEETLFKLFIENFGANIKVQNVVTRTFFIALLEQLGRLRHHEDLTVVGCEAGVAKVYSLLEADQFRQAYEVALCVYQFIQSKDGFKQSKNIPHSFKLSLYLAGLGVKKSADVKLQGSMIELSKAVLRETLTACRSLDIDLVQLQAAELNNLVRLMGEQKNYEDLEWLLTQLWHSRLVQRSWSATTVISVGRRLVEVLFVRNKQDASISLCESMTYNLRRTWGLLDQVTIDLFNLLSTLYVAADRHADALAIHEEILRAVLQDDESEDVLDDAHAAQIAADQLDLIKRVYARQGGWGDEDDDLSALVQDVVDQYGDASEGGRLQSFLPVDKWSTKAPPAHDTFGTFVLPQGWEFSADGVLANGAVTQRKPDYLLRWLQVNRQQSFGDLAAEANKQDAADSVAVAKVGGGAHGSGPIPIVVNGH
ncbi:Tetratricopeptide-like helical protein [Lasiodiplodia theobromae]|nr:Tetratricopeptide-like helical protein [Lasiodiplodia theobromae]